MRKTSKGTMTASPTDIFSVMLSRNCNIDDLLEDLKEAASVAELYSDGSEDLMSFEVLTNIQNVLTMKMKNFPGVSFQDSFGDTTDERKKRFKAWSKFWSHLSKLGYKIN